MDERCHLINAIPPFKVHRKQIYERFPQQYDLLAKAHDYKVSFAVNQKA